MPNKPTNTESICIVTNDFCIEQPRGGVGTFHYALANFLLENNFDVTVALLIPDRYEEVRKELNGKENLKFKVIEPPILPNLEQASWSRRASYDTYNWLKEKNFDFIHFHEWLGLGFYTLQAKKIGLAFHSSQICVGVHGPHEWILECNEQYLSNPDIFEIIFMEKKSIEMADVVWSPSEYMLNWLSSKNYKMPSSIENIHYLLPDYENSYVRAKSNEKISTLVFIGRIEYRKGIKLICDTYEKLIKEDKFCNLKLIFIGPEGVVNSLPGYDYICMRSFNWKVQPKIISGMNHKDLMQFLGNPTCGVLLPSLVDNSPLTVHECIKNEIPCITLATGGIPEFVADNSDALLNEASSKALSKAIEKMLTSPNNFILKYKIERSNVEKQWLNFHKKKIKTKEFDNTKQLSISVCITHHERPNQLIRAIDSALHQTKEALEIVIVDDGSQSENAKKTLKEIEENKFKIPVKVIRQKNLFVGAARNECVKYASGDYIVFLDDDNVMQENALEVLQNTLVNTNADIVTACYKSFKKNPSNKNCVDMYLPLGKAIETGVLWNCFGDTFSIQSKELFQSQGGYGKEKDTKFEDWEYLANIALNKLNIEIVPEALCWNELSSPRLSTHSPHFYNLNLSFRPYSKRVPSWSANIMQFMRGMYFEKAQTLKKRGRLEDYSDYLVDTRTIYSLSNNTHKELEPLHETNLNYIDNSLLIETTGDDPAFLLPELPFPNSGTVLVLIEIETSKECDFVIYYHKTENLNYTEQQSVRKKIKVGVNKFILKVFDDAIPGRLRIDPGNLPGLYKVNLLEMKLKE